MIMFRAPLPPAFCRGNRKSEETDVPLWCRLTPYDTGGTGKIQFCIFVFYMIARVTCALGLKYMCVTDDLNAIHHTCACSVHAQ